MTSAEGSVNDRPRPGRQRATTPQQDHYICFQHLHDRFRTTIQTSRHIRRLECTEGQLDPIQLDVDYAEIDLMQDDLHEETCSPLSGVENDLHGHERINDWHTDNGHLCCGPMNHVFT